MIIYLDDCLKVGYCTSGVVNYLKKHDKNIQDFFANGIDSSELPDDMDQRKTNQSQSNIMRLWNR